MASDAQKNIELLLVVSGIEVQVPFQFPNSKTAARHTAGAH
jgi:hypothetical protein